MPCCVHCGRTPTGKPATKFKHDLGLCKACFLTTGYRYKCTTCTGFLTKEDAHISSQGVFCADDDPFRCDTCTDEFPEKFGVFGITMTRCRGCHDADPECKDQHEHCALTAKCCLCMDKRIRSETGRYSGYEDGYGWIEKDSRYAYYCEPCKRHYSDKYGLCYICFIGAADFPIHPDSEHAHSVCKSCYGKLKPADGEMLKCPICRAPEEYALA
jgi:hypothetical protein